ncbi:MAG: hypothetical protein PHP50_13050, partial [Lachnospiraceae bacterium]|nr:hypothetical protein [Lachnospiraceae bacterium]
IIDAPPSGLFRDWHLEVFSYYKVKNAVVYDFSTIHPNIYFRTIIILRKDRVSSENDIIK